MEAFDKAIGQGLELFQRLCEKDPGLTEEFRATRAGFEIDDSPEGSPGERALAERRHLEWFVLERYSDALGDVPVRGKLEAWEKLADPIVRDHSEALLDSRASAFNVTSIDAGGTVWTRDLFGGGEFPLFEKGSASAHQVDDLLVGRIFPVGEGAFRLSPAASSFRNPGLVAALQSDVESLRKSRRGSLRIQQSELERLFFSALRTPEEEAGESTADSSTETEPDEPERLTRTEALVRARTELQSAGLDGELATEVCATLAEAVQKGSPAAIVTEALNHLAFDTEADLEGLRNALTELWQNLQDPAPEPKAGGGDARSLPAGRGPAKGMAGEADTSAAAHALAKFDEGRASGADLEELFRGLEEDLGLEPEVVRDEEIAPDFPGVVGAVLEEYRWDLRREGNARASEDAAVLESLAEHSADIGVFEELGARELIDYAGRWLFENARDPLACVRALPGFLSWCEEQHCHPLASRAGEAIAAIERDLPRIVRARRAFGESRAEGDWWKVVSLEDGLELTSLNGREELRLGATEAALAELLPGDLVRAQGEAVTGVYPGALAILLDGVSEPPKS